MLTSSANQYLRPEYLTPLHTTLDSKKSPLALLAQTCSQIGVDPPTSKSLGSHDKPSKSNKSSTDSSNREKSSPSSHNNNNTTTGLSSMMPGEGSKMNSSFKPYESCVMKEKSASPEQPRIPSAHSNSGSNSRSRTPGNSGNGKRCSSNQSASSSGGRATTPQSRKSTTPSNETTTRESPNTRQQSGHDAIITSASSPSLQVKPAFSLAHVDPLGSFRPMNLIASTSAGGATTTTTPASYHGLAFPPQLSHLDPVTASSIMSQHHAAAAAAAMKGSLGHHPYLSYARMKTPTGGETLVPVCRDPYCTGCQLSSHMMGGATPAPNPANGTKAPPTSQATGSNGTSCPAGCAQCDHKPQQMSAAASAAAAASGPYAAYHAQLVALATASQMPYICNWISSDAAYCGKRFANPDEFVQHFRTHTGGAPSPGEPSASAAATTAAALSLLSPPGLAPGHPLLSRTYPTPPLSPLTAARYHPYGKPPYGHPGISALGLPLPPPHGLPTAAGLPPYFSPYASLYAGTRLGAASGMHP
ncbi:zinc finger protein Elbow isoform X1 [Trichogramma pretiosum]|uniref:zinc finger protein Elbow isoform X1 n=1 Tax=Trichogramma pretiosum TaxID=7493 RepID=UPI0006C9D9A6|nr:zinc finger protein Elbow isoform X1 [Trichogramma pretiosum]